MLKSLTHSIYRFQPMCGGSGSESKPRVVARLSKILAIAFLKLARIVDPVHIADLS